MLLRVGSAVPVAAVMYSPVSLLAMPLFTGRSFADVLAQPRARPGSLRIAPAGTPAPMGVGDIGSLVRREHEANARIVKSANIRAE